MMFPKQISNILLRKLKTWALIFLIVLSIYSLSTLDGMNQSNETIKKLKRNTKNSRDTLKFRITRNNITLNMFSIKIDPLKDLKKITEEVYSCDQHYPTTNADYDTFEILGKRIINNIPNDEPEQIAVPKGKLKVFFLPMTHVDPGWLRTVDSYSNDTNSILNNMVQFLSSHPQMRFLWCEMVFFEKWWSQIDEKSKTKVRKFIKEGRLQIASGSWVMTDEANPYFPVTIDNIIEGQRFTYNELGIKAEVIWSNDPFGYGPSVPYLFRKTGITKAVINRIDYRVKSYLQSRRAIPFMWRQHFDSDGKNDIYTHVLPYGHYDILSSCGPTSSVCCRFDFKRITHFGCGEKVVPVNESNVEQMSHELEEQLLEMSKMYESNALLVMWGDDFRYDMIEEWYQQYDNLSPIFNFINKGDRMNIRFGTFNDYFNALDDFNQIHNLKTKVLTGDFFPYVCALHSYWTGYYTTRPFYKRQERHLHALIRSADLLSTEALKFLEADEKMKIINDLIVARRNLALFQHHDAITGTSRNHVMKDYSNRLFVSQNLAVKVIEKSMRAITENKFEFNNLLLKWDEIISKKLLNITTQKEIFIAVYNSLPYRVIETISLRISSLDVRVTSDSGLFKVEAQIEPYFDWNTGRFNGDEFLLVFNSLLEPLSTKIFTLKHGANPSTHMVDLLLTDKLEVFENNKASFSKFNIEEINKEDFHLSNEHMKTIHDSETGLLRAISLSSDFTEFTQSFHEYTGTISGAYVLRISGEAKPVEFKISKHFITKGPIRQTAYIISNEIQLQYVVRNLKENDGERLDVNVRINYVKGIVQRELITRFSTNLPKKSTSFYSDSIGLQLIKRNSFDKLAVDANYYPMPTTAVLQSHSKRITVLSNVEHGVRFFKGNQLEIMLERELKNDDHKGLGQSTDGIPNDMRPVEMTFSIVIENLLNKERAHGQLLYHTYASHLTLQSLLYPPIVLHSSDESNYKSPELLPLPCDVQLLTSRPISEDTNKRLVIFHRNGIDCDGRRVNSCSSFNELKKALRKYLKAIAVKEIQQTTLNGIDKIGPIKTVFDDEIEWEEMDFPTYIITF